MAITLTQTDTAAIDGAIQACSTTALIASPVSAQATSGGTAGSTTHGATIPASSSGVAYCFESALLEPDNTSWQSGNWVVRINQVSTANAQITWDSCFICRVNSAGVNQGTVASGTGLAISFGTTGVHSVTLSGSAQPSAAAGDRIYITIGLHNSSSMNATSVTLKFDQNIDTPITQGAGSTAPIGKIISASQALNRASTY